MREDLSGGSNRSNATTIIKKYEAYTHFVITSGYGVAA